MTLFARQRVRELILDLPLQQMSVYSSTSKKLFVVVSPIQLAKSSAVFEVNKGVTNVSTLQVFAVHVNQ